MFFLSKCHRASLGMRCPSNPSLLPGRHQTGVWRVHHSWFLSTVCVGRALIILSACFLNKTCSGAQMLGTFSEDSLTCPPPQSSSCPPPSDCVSPSLPQFFSEYEKLLHSENYVTKRQSLKVRSVGVVGGPRCVRGAALLKELFREGRGRLSQYWVSKTPPRS